MSDLTIDELKEKIKFYERKLEEYEKPQGAKNRGKIAAMSSEVVDSNPYSRLMALKRMGIVDNYEVLALKLTHFLLIKFMVSDQIGH